jgi:hypothetical protein
VKLRTYCTRSELVIRIQELIDSKKIRVWSVCDDQYLVLSHKKYGGCFKFFQTRNSRNVLVEVGKNDYENGSRLVGAMIGMLERHFRNELKSVEIVYHKMSTQNGS